MSMYLAFDESEPFEVASNFGWGQFVHFAERLSGVEQLSHLITYGWCQHPVELIEDLNAAAEWVEDADVRSVLDSVLSVVRGNEDKGVVLVTNGIGTAKEEDASTP